MSERKMRIMIIEDEMCIRDSLQWFLEDLGHDVIAGDSPFDCNVYSGGQCTKRVSCTDVLIIDQHLPGTRGMDFIEQLTEKGCKGITSNMLLMSGDSTSIDLKRAESLGVNVVQKPMDFEYLESWLNNLDLE